MPGKPIRAAQMERKTLLRWDPSGATYIEMRQCRAGQEDERNECFNEYTVERQPGKRTWREIYKLPGPKLPILECWLSYVDSNLTIEDLKEKGLDPEVESNWVTVVKFSDKMTREEFYTAFAQLPNALMDEWHDLVLEVNPHWDPEKVAEVQKNSRKSETP